MSEQHKNYIDGIWQDAASRKTFDDINPAVNSDKIGAFPNSGVEDVDDAVRAARRAFQSWSRMPAPERGNILKNIGDILTDRKSKMAFEMTREMGKPFLETKGDVQEAIDTAYYAASETRRLFGHTVPSELPSKFNMSIRRPIGVCGIISAWNFPVAVPTWKIFPALACGNTVVFKPSSDAPHSGALLIKAMADAGVPPGVLNLTQGSGGVGRAIVEHPDVNVVSFTGSTAVGSKIGEACGRMHKRVTLELGGKNPMIVMQDANLDLALEGLLWGAFGTTGQRCTATSRLIIHEDVHDEFVGMLKEASEKLKLGYGNEETTEVGPVINKRALETIIKYVQVGKDEGATMICGGNVPKGDGVDAGFFFEPTIFTDVTPTMRIAKEEIFGPVLAVLKISSYEEAIEVANNVEYGLSSSIYTQDVSVAFNAMHDIEAGITYINGPTIGAEAHMPFGGVKATGNGHREGGWEVYDFYTETKTVYVDYSGTLQKAQIDNARDRITIPAQ